MDYGIIVDSCCDLSEELRLRLGVISVPLKLLLGEREYVDDDSLDLPGFMSDMKSCADKIGSASPSPFLFKEAILKMKRSFVVTLSKKLSGTYDSAVVGKAMAEEEDAGVYTHIFDSKTASAGMVLITIKIRELIQKGLPTQQIISAMNSFIDSMKTYLVLDNYDNLLKNGRLSKITEKIIRTLNIKLVMRADGDGNIELADKVRGRKQALDKLASTIEKSGRQTRGENIVITHNNNFDMAKQLSELISQRYNFKEIFILPTRGISSLYADDQGVVMAF